MNLHSSTPSSIRRIAMTAIAFVAVASAAGCASTPSSEEHVVRADAKGNAIEGGYEPIRMVDDSPGGCQPSGCSMSTIHAAQAQCANSTCSGGSQGINYCRDYSACGYYYAYTWSCACN